MRLGLGLTGTSLLLFQRESRSTVGSHLMVSAERWLLARAVGRVQLGCKSEQQLLSADSCLVFGFHMEPTWH
jgi:hypothetical protein